MSVSAEMSWTLREEPDAMLFVLPSHLATRVAGYVEQLLADETEVQGYKTKVYITKTFNGMTIKSTCKSATSTSPASCGITVYPT